MRFIQKIIFLSIAFYTVHTYCMENIPEQDKPKIENLTIELGIAPGVETIVYKGAQAQEVADLLKKN